MASAVAFTVEWGRCVSDFVRGLGRNLCAVVARWEAVGFYFKPQRQYGIVVAADSRRDAAEAGGDGEEIFAAPRPTAIARCGRG